MTDLSSSPLIAALVTRLDALASPQSRDFWQRYLKGAVPFRGVPMAGIRRAVHTWWQADGPAGLSPSARQSLALALFRGSYAEEKLAGTLVLQELLLDTLNPADLAEFALLFEHEWIADWNTCDWFCVKVLGPLVARERPLRTCADAIASWCTARTVWQRRAANVAFVNLARHGDQNFAGFTRLMLDTCAVTVRSPQRFAQTGVGWLLRELAEAERDSVLAFTDEHLALLSREALRYVVERLPDAQRSALLTAHRRLPRPPHARRP
jgi:3-methyladenine DNA glycosylase AlkD